MITTAFVSAATCRIRTKLIPLADGITMAAPSPLTAVLWHHNGGTEKVIGYLPGEYPMPDDTDETYFTLNEPGALAQEEADALEWERHHRPAVVCPWDLPGADQPLTQSQQAIFTPDPVTPDGENGVA